MDGDEGRVVVDIPDGCIINGEIAVTSYMDTDGKLKFGYATTGEINLAQVIGMLELAKILVYRNYTRNEPYEPDGLEDEDEEDE